MADDTKHLSSRAKTLLGRLGRVQTIIRERRKRGLPIKEKQVRKESLIKSIKQELLNNK